MAITASIAVSNASPVSMQKIAATCTVSNSGGADVLVTGCQPLYYGNGSQSTGPSGAIGVPPLGPGMNLTVPAGGTLKLTWDLVAFKPQGGYVGNPAEFGQAELYLAGATIYTNDGSVTTASTATVTNSHFP